MIYESIYIVSSKIEEKERLAVTEKVEVLLREFNAKIVDKTNGVEKRLAYAIKHEEVGYYFTIRFEVEPDQLMKLEDKLKTINGILRLQIFKSKDLFEKEKKKEKPAKKEEKVDLTEKKITEDLFKDDILEI
jgi:ribosomal protein S6